MLARISFAEGRALLCLVINEKELKPAKYFVERLQEALTHANNKFELVGILKNVNTRKTNVILGESTKQLWGRDYLHEKIGGLELELSIDSFFQINPIQTQRLYDIALELAAPTRNDLVIDAYCGIGSIALWVAPHAKEVYGIEENRSAVKDAEANAQRNRIRNAYFTCGRVEDVFEDYIDAGLRPDIIILDPPRSGCDKRVIESAIKFSPKKIVYVSCDPATLARDLKLLSSAYNVESVQPVDMFPQTSHIECVAKLTKLLSTQPFQTF
jgi:23S rRNA (uracil-5-)-methyltransferase RumA